MNKIAKKTLIITLTLALVVIPAISAYCATVPDLGPGQDGYVNQDDYMDTNQGTVITNNGRIQMNESNGVVQTNNEYVDTNNGSVKTNNRNIQLNESNGVVQTNNGNVATNNGTVKTNNIKGTVETNNGTVETNNHTVETNNGNVGTNKGTVETNNGTVKTNNHTVLTNNGNVGTNKWTVRINNIEGNVETNNHTVVTNNGNVGTNKGTVETNNGTVETNTRSVITNNGNVEENLGEITKNTANAVVNTNDGSIVNNAGTVETNNRTIETNTGTVVNSEEGVVEVNFGGSVTAGTVKINLGDSEVSDDTTVLQQFWGVLSNAWSNLGFTADTGNTYDKHTDETENNDVKIWLWDEGSMLLKSNTDEPLKKVSIKNGSAGTATITKVRAGEWAITSITGNIELDTEFGEEEPSKPVEPTKPAPEPKKPVESQNTADIIDVSPVTPMETTITPVAVAIMPTVSAIQVAIDVDGSTVSANTSLVSDEQIAGLQEMAQSAIGPAYTVFGAFKIEKPAFDFLNANTDNSTLIASVRGLTKGMRIYLMFTDNTGHTRYLPYTLTADNEIVKKIKGISDGGMITILVKK